MRIDRTDFNKNLLDWGFRENQLKVIYEMMIRHIYPQIDQAITEAKVSAKSQILALVDEMIKQKTANKKLANTFPVNDTDQRLISNYEYCIDELSELKQKIEAL